MTYKMGTKYKCTKCESEFVIIKATPEAAITCCDEEVEQ